MTTMASQITKFRRRSKKTSKLRVTGLCVGNSPGPVNSPHKGPVTRKMFPFDDVIMEKASNRACCTSKFYAKFQTYRTIELDAVDERDFMRYIPKAYFMLQEPPCSELINKTNVTHYRLYSWLKMDVRDSSKRTYWFRHRHMLFLVYFAVYLVIDDEICLKLFFRNRRVCQLTVQIRRDMQRFLPCL